MLSVTKINRCRLTPAAINARQSRCQILAQRSLAQHGPIAETQTLDRVFEPNRLVTGSNSQRRHGGQFLIARAGSVAVDDLTPVQRQRHTAEKLFVALEQAQP